MTKTQIDNLKAKAHTFNKSHFNHEAVIDCDTLLRLIYEREELYQVCASAGNRGGLTGIEFRRAEVVGHEFKATSRITTDSK
jgi:hypothetical protein